MSLNKSWRADEYLAVRWVGLVLVAGCSRSAAAEPFDAGLSTRVMVTGEATWALLPTDAGYQRVGLFTPNVQVEVTGCETRYGHARLRSGLEVYCEALQSTDAGVFSPVDLPLRWGTVRKGGTLVRALPAADAAVLERLNASYTVALQADDLLQKQGWLRRPRGGYVRLDDVRLDEPSSFQGTHLPQLPLAFVVKDTPPSVLDGGARAFSRREAVRVLEVAPRQVLTENGVIARSAVRLAFARPRPLGVPENAKWVHVDLNEQVLTAYEGSRAVFATLVSTGLVDIPSRRTHVGLYQVWFKSRHDRMHGEGYFVEEVPFVMFFRRGEGLHGTFWHDAFGFPASHGCVNLSMADARWLFDWAPPELPQGWHTLYPGPLGLPSLFVQLERSLTPPVTQPLHP